MDFAWEDSATAVRDLAVEVLRRESERAGDDNDAAHEALWKALGEAGLLSLAVGEDAGGAGLGPVEVSAVLREIGRRAAPVPALATTAFAVLPIARLGTPEQQSVLSGVEGGRVLTAAFHEPSEPFPRSPRVTARRDGDELVLSGTKTAVQHVESAHRALVSVSCDGEPAVVIADLTAEGVRSSSRSSSAGTPSATVRFDEARLSHKDILGGRTGPNMVEELHRSVLCGLCAVADGALAGALDLTAEYVRTRTQFDRPLAAFQSVAGQIADVYVTARTMSLAATSACWRWAEGLDADEDLAVASFWLAEELPAAARTCHHLHGGVGVDVTYPMHRYYSLLKDLSALAGGSAERLDHLATV